MNDARINQPYSLLRFVFGVVPIVAGLDKFTNLLADWRQYLSPVLAGMLPLSPATFMHVVGVIEIAAGVIVLTRLVRIGAFIVAAWLACIALQLLTTGKYFDVAVRDLMLAASAFALGRLAELRQSASQSAGERVPTVRP